MRERVEGRERRVNQERQSSIFEHVRFSVDAVVNIKHKRQFSLQQVEHITTQRIMKAYSPDNPPSILSTDLTLLNSSRWRAAEAVLTAGYKMLACAKNVSFP